MAAIKISLKIDEKVWNELCSMARDSRQSASGLLMEAIREYIKRHRVRPVVVEHLEHSVADNERLGELLAR